MPEEESFPVFENSKCTLCGSNHSTVTDRRTHVESLEHKKKFAVHKLIQELQTREPLPTSVLGQRYGRAGVPTLGSEHLVEVHASKGAPFWICKICHVVEDSLLCADEHVHSCEHLQACFMYYKSDGESLWQKYKNATMGVPETEHWMIEYNILLEQVRRHGFYEPIAYQNSALKEDLLKDFTIAPATKPDCKVEEITDLHSVVACNICHSVFFTGSEQIQLEETWEQHLGCHQHQVAVMLRTYLSSLPSTSKSNVPPAISISDATEFETRDDGISYGPAVGFEHCISFGESDYLCSLCFCVVKCAELQNHFSCEAHVELYLRIRTPSAFVNTEYDSLDHRREKLENEIKDRKSGFPPPSFLEMNVNLPSLISALAKPENRRLMVVSVEKEVLNERTAVFCQICNVCFLTNNKQTWEEHVFQEDHFEKLMLCQKTVRDPYSFINEQIALPRLPRKRKAQWEDRGTVQNVQNYSEFGLNLIFLDKLLSQYVCTCCYEFFDVSEPEQVVIHARSLNHVKAALCVSNRNMAAELLFTRNETQLKDMVLDFLQNTNLPCQNEKMRCFDPATAFLLNTTMKVPRILLQLAVTDHHVRDNFIRDNGLPISNGEVLFSDDSDCVCMTVALDSTSLVVSKIDGERIIFWCMDCHMSFSVLLTDFKGLWVNHLLTEMHNRRANNIRQNNLGLQALQDLPSSYQPLSISATVNPKKAPWIWDDNSNAFIFAMNNKLVLDDVSHRQHHGVNAVYCSLCCDIIDLCSPAVNAHIRSLKHLIFYLHKYCSADIERFEQILNENASDIVGGRAILRDHIHEMLKGVDPKASKIQFLDGTPTTCRYPVVQAIIDKERNFAQLALVKILARVSNLPSLQTVSIASMHRVAIEMPNGVRPKQQIPLHLFLENILSQKFPDSRPPVETECVPPRIAVAQAPGTSRAHLGVNPLPISVAPVPVPIPMPVPAPVPVPVPPPQACEPTPMEISDDDDGIPSSTSYRFSDDNRRRGEVERRISRSPPDKNSGRSRYYGSESDARKSRKYFYSPSPPPRSRRSSSSEHRRSSNPYSQRRSRFDSPDRDRRYAPVSPEREHRSRTPPTTRRKRSQSPLVFDFRHRNAAATNDYRHRSQISPEPSYARLRGRRSRSRSPAKRVRRSWSRSPRPPSVQLRGQSRSRSRSPSRTPSLPREKRRRRWDVPPPPPQQHPVVQNVPMRREEPLPDYQPVIIDDLMDLSSESSNTPPSSETAPTEPSTIEELRYLTSKKYLPIITPETPVLPTIDLTHFNAPPPQPTMAMPRMLHAPPGVMGMPPPPVGLPPFSMPPPPMYGMPPHTMSNAMRPMAGYNAAPPPPQLDQAAVILRAKMDLYNRDLVRMSSVVELVDYLLQQGHDPIPPTDPPLLFNEVVKKCKGVLGADLVCQIICYNNPDLETYLCLLCRHWTTVSETFPHLRSRTHRLNYFLKSYKLQHARVEALTDDDEKERALQENAFKIWQLEGSKQCNTRMRCVLNEEAIGRLWPEYQEKIDNSWKLGEVEEEEPIAPKSRLVDDDRRSASKRNDDRRTDRDRHRSPSPPLRDRRHRRSRSPSPPRKRSPTPDNRPIWEKQADMFRADIDRVAQTPALNYDEIDKMQNERLMAKLRNVRSSNGTNNNTPSSSSAAFDKEWNKEFSRREQKSPEPVEERVSAAEKRRLEQEEEKRRHRESQKHLSALVLIRQDAMKLKRVDKENVERICKELMVEPEKLFSDEVLEEASKRLGDDAAIYQLTAIAHHYNNPLQPPPKILQEGGGDSRQAHPAMILQQIGLDKSSIATLLRRVTGPQLGIVEKAELSSEEKRKRRGKRGGVKQRLREEFAARMRAQQTGPSASSAAAAAAAYYNPADYGEDYEAAMYAHSHGHEPSAGNHPGYYDNYPSGSDAYYPESYYYERPMAAPAPRPHAYPPSVKGKSAEPSHAGPPRPQTRMPSAAARPVYEGQPYDVHWPPTSAPRKPPPPANAPRPPVAASGAVYESARAQQQQYSGYYEHNAPPSHPNPPSSKPHPTVDFSRDMNDWDAAANALTDLFK